MKKVFRNIVLWLFIKLHSLFIHIGIALRNTEIDILTPADPNDNDDRKRIQVRWIRSALLQKFEAGQRDEKYVQDYYELLRKADKFMLSATERDMAIASDKYSMNYGFKDKWGRRYEHYGFFDEKHKNSGKTIGEVIEEELKERKTQEDDYELLFIYNNQPIQAGLSKVEEFVDQELNMKDLQQKSKTFEFPLKVVRKNERVVNKIEQLTDYLHVKKIGFEHRQLEFFVNKKFKTREFDNNTTIIKEIVDIEQVYVKNIYGDLLGFTVNEFVKRIDHEEFDVFVFHGIEMETITMK
jgi:hypothetical protein